MQISSAFAIIFADCHGLSCVHVRASSYTALFRVSLRGVGHKCVGLAQKISARCNTGFYVFSFFFICIFILLLALSHMYVFFIPSARSLRFGSRLWKVNIDQNWNLFYHYLFQRTPVLSCEDLLISSLHRSANTWIFIYLKSWTPVIYKFISQENMFLFAIYFH